MENAETKLNALEAAVLTKLADGPDQVLEMLRAQVAVATVTSRKFTGVGFYTSFLVPEEVPGIPGVHRGPFGDVLAEMEGLRHGADFLLWFDKTGRMSKLEGFTYDEPWPATVRGLALRYANPKRNLMGIDPSEWTKPKR